MNGKGRSFDCPDREKLDDMVLAGVGGVDFFNGGVSIGDILEPLRRSSKTPPDPPWLNPPA